MWSGRFSFFSFLFCTGVQLICCGSFRWTAKGLSHKCTKDTPEKGLLSKIYKELSKLSNKKTTQFKNWLKILADTSPKKVYRWKVSVREDAPHHMSSGKCKLKQCHYTPIRSAKVWNTDNTKCCGRGMWSNRNSHPMLVGMQKVITTLEDWRFLTK